MADMHCANQKSTKLLKELETKAGLIEHQRQGQGKPTRIYVKDFATGLHGDGDRKCQILTHENRESRDVKIISPDSWKSFINNTNTSQTDFSQTDLINLSAESANPGAKVVRMDDLMQIRKQYEDYLREKLGMDILIQSNSYEVGRINEIFDLMVDVLCSTAKTICISGVEKSLRKKLMKSDTNSNEIYQRQPCIHCCNAYRSGSYP